MFILYERNAPPQELLFGGRGSEVVSSPHARPAARTVPADTILLVGLSGRGDKDMGTVAATLGIEP